MLKSVLNQILAESDFKVLSDWTTTWGKNVEASLWFLSLVLLQISTPGIKVFFATRSFTPYAGFNWKGTLCLGQEEREHKPDKQNNNNQKTQTDSNKPKHHLLFNQHILNSSFRCNCIISIRLNPDGNQGSKVSSSS